MTGMASLASAEVDGKPMDIAAFITGTLDDGSEIFPAETGDGYISQSGPVVSQSDYGDWIRLDHGVLKSVF